MKILVNQFYYICLIVLLSFGLIAQTTSTSATYSSGNIGTASNGFNPRSVATNSTCAGLLTVNVPVGRYVTGVDVVYDMEALGFSVLNDQWSYLECTTTGNKESQVSSGIGFNTGVQSYSRTGLNIANGTVPAGGLEFELSAFRDFAFFGCNSNEHRVNNNTWIVTVHHIAAPTCLPPTNLSITGITTNSASLSWTSGGASNWQIEYGPSGFIPGTGTIVGLSTNPFTLSGLSASTDYDIRLRDSCGSTDVSFWTPINTFTTLCAVFTAPWTEDFESVDWVVPNAFGGGIGSVNSCFERNANGDLVFVVGPALFAQPNTGPSVDHTTGSGKYVFSNLVNFGGNPPFNARLKTPPIDLSALTSPEMSVWYHMFGADIGDFQVAVSANGAPFTVLNTITGQQQTSKGAAWTELILDLSTYANDTVVVRFRSIQTAFGFDGNMAIDDISIYEKPTCPKPSALISTANTETSISLSWTSGGATNWQIEYGPVGFSTGTGTLLNVSTNPFTVNGLTNSTTYDFYLRDSCSTTDLSSWFGPLKASTSCGVISAPYIENFDGSTFVPPVNFNDTGDVDICWARNMTDYYWTAGPPAIGFGATGPSADHTSGSGQYSYTETSFGFGVGPFVANLETPSIDLSALTNPQLTFWYHMFGADIGSLDVEIDNGSGYTNLITYTGQQQTSSADLWKEAIISLTAYANDTVKIRFTGNLPVLGFQAQIAIDDLEIDETPTCPKPQNLQTTTTSNSATLNWTTGGATNWQVEYGVQGFSMGSGTLVNTSTNPLTINSLSPNTIYDFYLRDSCGATDLSSWVGPITDTTECTAFVAPYTENFDGTDWVPTDGFNAGNISQCWSRNATTGFYWTTEQLGTTSNNTGPSADHTSGSGKFVYSEGFAFNGTTQLTSPSIDISSLTAPELRFWYHMFGANISRLEVEIFDGTTWTLANTITGQQHASSIAVWDEEIVSLASYSGTIKVRFTAIGTNFGFEGNMALDDFWIGNTPTCPAPSNISTVSTTLNSITLDWITGGATNWQLKYRVSGSTGTYTTLPVASKPFTISGLSPSTNYEILVQDSCGTGDVSFWIGPHFENTLCGTIIAPWTESFDGGSWVSGIGFDNIGNQIDACWNRNTAILQQWGTRSGGTNSINTGPSGAFSGSKYIYTEASGGANGIANISSPSVYIHPGIQSPKLYFHYHMFGADITSLEIEISSNGGAFTSIYSKLGEQQNAETDPWEKDSVDLITYSGDTIILRFIGNNTAFLGDMALDEISISGSTTPCLDPSNLTISNLGTNSMDINWTSSNPGLTQLSYYDIATGPPGLTVNNVSSPYTLNSLIPNITYVISVQDSCPAASISASISDTVTTGTCSSITAGFNFTTTLLSANFTSTSVNADSLIWNFDGTTISNLQNPNHTYPTAGTYTVKLIAFNGCGTSDTITKAVQVCDSLIADFTFNQNGDTLNFNGSSSIGANTYSWNFGDGNDTTGIQTGSHVYSSSGTYTITLTVYNGCGDSAVFSETTNSCAQPVANWTYTIIGTTGQGMEVQFDASSSLNGANFSWDFGDGNTNTTSAIPTHTYVTPSLQYTVSLTVTNLCNQTDNSTYRLDQIGLEDLIVIHTAIDLYPNPAKDLLKIRLVNNDSEFDARIKLFDMSGRMVKDEKMMLSQSDETELDIQSIPSGIYTLEIILDNELQHFPLIIR